MLMPTTQRESCISLLNEAHSANDEKTVCFHGWNITELPRDVLWMITDYLSLDDVRNLGRSSRKMNDALMECGSFEARQLRKLPKQKQLFYRNLSIANPALVHYLKTEKIQLLAHQFHPDENLPALCAYHADCLRHQTIQAPSVNCVLKDAIGRDDEIDFCHYRIDHRLNNHHTRLIIKDRHNASVHIWTKEIDNSWNKEITIKRGRFYCLDIDIPNADINIFFAPVLPIRDSFGYASYNAKDPIMAIYERNDVGLWSETQRLTFDEIYPCDDHEKHPTPLILHFIPSHDGHSLMYFNSHHKGNAIIGRTVNGKWISSGLYPRGKAQTFSPNSCHIAIRYDHSIHLLSKNGDGSWSDSGKLELKIERDQQQYNRIGFNNIVFSPDSRHLFACFNRVDNRTHDEPVYLTDFCVVIASLSDDGHWSETAKMTKRSEYPTDFFQLNATFSPDGKHLVVCGKHNFDIWRLNDDNRWSPITQNHDYFQKVRISPFSIEPEVTFTMDSSAFLLLNVGSANVWRLRNSGQWTCEHRFTFKEHAYYLPQRIRPVIHIDAIISPDGTSILTRNKNDLLDIWVRNPQGEWNPQHFDDSVSFLMPRFNQEGYLLAALDGNDDSRLVVLGLTNNGSWKAKGCLQVESHIVDFSFSSCGRSLQISFRKEGRNLITFWQIMPEP